MSSDEKELVGAAWVILLFLAAIGAIGSVSLWLLCEFLSAW
ncbi:hypothetical protein PP460_gp016 [Streptomyces phage Muntaha]|uniref:Uncharacterized protein n=1 Tax=Streptomyces phage Muntaha TaxID=2713269 RepID=A0A6G8R3P5_9CAUD|nr:hypothetical protein PP460_gp016 [Streptomyces phage Muntaha]QIN94786.1 hypothetical protein SEA_MUNTAHA_263 [Streptomyces phage Muntaha]